MRIGTNIAAYMAGAQLANVEKKLTQSTNRLSSGYKINCSKDDPAGMAMTQKLRVQISELNRSGINASDGVSVIDTTESVLSEVESMLQRMRELAVQGASDTYTDEDRKNIMSEISQLQSEIDRVSEDTQFNNQNLLDGSFERRTYVFNDSDRMTSDVSVLYVSDDISAGTYELTVSDGKIDVDDDTIQKMFGEGATVRIDGNKADIITHDGSEISFALNNESADGTYIVEVEDIGGMPIQVGNNEGQNIDVIIPRVDTSVLHIDDLDFSTADGASEAITKLDTAISLVSKFRSNLGAYQNRLESVGETISATTESLTGALSKIADTNMAEEMTEYTSQNVLQQAGISMLSQANQMPEKVLQLLQ